MKKLSLSLLGLATVLVAALLIAPSFVDWNAHKGRIAKEIFDLTGRDLAIDGDVSLAILPAPALSAARVRLANIEGGSAPAMVELDALKVRIALLPLLRGEVQVESVDLVRPRILAEVLPDGRKNWEIEAGGGVDRPATDPDAPAGGVAGAIRLDLVTITDGTLIYRDAAAGQEERIEGLYTEVAADSLKGPFEAKGQAKIRGMVTEFDVSLGGLVSAGATPLSLTLGVPEAAATLQLAGALSRHGERVSLRGRLKGRGESLAALVAALPFDMSLPPVFARPFSTETDIAADQDGVAISKLSVQLGDTKAEGDLRFTLQPRRDFQASLSTTQIDLDALLAPPAGGEAGATPSGGAASTSQESPSPAPAPTPDETAALSLPADMTGSLDLSVDAVIYRGQVVRQFILSLALAEGQLKLNQALALLPGGSDVSLSGVVSPIEVAGQTDLRFDGRLEAGSDNFRGILDWLGIDVAQVPASRLRKLGLITNIGATRSTVMLSDIDMRFDLTQVSGGVAVAIRDRLGIGVGLALDKIDLDAYLPTPSRAAPAKDAAPEAGGAPDPAKTTPAGPAQTATARARFAAPSVLGDFDANFDLRVGQMTLHGASAENLHLDATLQQGSVALREFLVGSLGGAKARLAGTVAALTTTPTLDLAYSLSAPDPARLAKALDLPPGPLAKAKDLKLSGTVKGRQDALELTSGLEILGARLEARGEVMPLSEPLRFDLTTSAKHAKLAQLAGVLAPDLKFGPSLGALDLRARLSGTPQDIAVSELSGQLGPLTLEGGLAARLGGLEPGVSDINLAVVAKHRDLAALTETFAPDAGLAPGLGLDLKARIQGAQDTLNFSDIAGTLGPTEVKGTVGLDLTGARPMITADLETGVLPLAAFTAPRGESAKKAKAIQPAAAGKSASGGSAGGAEAKAAARWSRQPIDVAALGQVDADIKLRAAALVHETHRLNNTVIDAALTEGVLDLRKVNGTFHDGAIALTGQIDTRDGIEAGLALTAIELNLAKLAQALADSDRVSGPLNLDASITAKGASEAALITSLAGTGKLGGTVNVKVKAEEQVGNIILGILGEKLKEVRGVTETTNVLFGAFAGTPAALAGTFVIKGGVAETRDLRLEGREANALTQGTADLAAWKVDTQTEVFKAADPNTAFVTAKLTGPLDKPNVKVGGLPFQRQKQPAAQPVLPVQPAQPGAEATPAPAQPTAPAQIKPEDIIKQGLKGLLKGLTQ